MRLKVYNFLTPNNPELLPALQCIKSHVQTLQAELQKLVHKINKLAEPDAESIFATPIYGNNTNIPKGAFNLLPIVKQGNNIKVTFMTKPDCVSGSYFLSLSQSRAQSQ